MLYNMSPVFIPIAIHLNQRWTHRLPWRSFHLLQSFKKFVDGQAASATRHCHPLAPPRQWTRRVMALRVLPLGHRGLGCSPLRLLFQMAAYQVSSGSSLSQYQDILTSNPPTTWGLSSTTVCICQLQELPIEKHMCLQTYTCHSLSYFTASGLESKPFIFIGWMVVQHHLKPWLVPWYCLLPLQSSWLGVSLSGDAYPPKLYPCQFEWIIHQQTLTQGHVFVMFIFVFGCNYRVLLSFSIGQRHVFIMWLSWMIFLPR